MCIRDRVIAIELNFATVIAANILCMIHAVNPVQIQYRYMVRVKRCLLILFVLLFRQVRRFLPANGELRHPGGGQERLRPGDGRRSGHAQGLFRTLPGPSG